MLLIPTLLHLLCLSALPAEPVIIHGYANRISAFPGDSVELYIHASAASPQFSMNLYDLNGIKAATWHIPIFEQNKLDDHSYENGYGYKRTSKVRLPFLKSGLYLFDNKIPLIVKSPHAKIVVLYSSNTLNAYCSSGGKSMYGFNSTGQTGAEKVSFLRPIALPRHSEAFFRWLINQPIEDVGYIADIDLEDYQAIKKSSLLIIPGHSEYWTLQARKNFDRFISEGKDALILSGNTMWWQVRYNKNKDQLICYRNAKKDPVKSAKLKTVNWNDLTLGYPITFSIGADFSFGGYGLQKDNGWNGFKIISNSPLLAGTDLKAGDILACPSDELDGSPLTGFSNGMPVLNTAALAFAKAEIIGFDLVTRGGREGVATWIVFKRTKASGVVINTASTDWCSSRGIGNNTAIQRITSTMIRKLLNKEDVFSNDPGMEWNTTIN